MSDQDLIANALVDEDVDVPPGTPGKPARAAGDDGWWPLLNKQQKAIFNDERPVVFAVGEKGTGKTVGCLHRLVRHCYENFNALAYVIAPTQSSGYEGAGYDLVNLVLPTWRDGNRHPPYIRVGTGLIRNPKAGELIDNGIGMQYTQWKLDPVTKDRHLWIQNKYGLWSKVVLKSILFPSLVEARIKGPAPSFIYLEEATNCEGKEYLTFPRAQLGRRRYIQGTQQFLASCNPDDPDKNWVFEVLYKDSLDPNGTPWPDDCHQPGIKRDRMYAVHYVPYAENLHWLGEEYRKNLESTFRSDPILWARLIEGKWLAYPSGVALFRLYFAESRHMVGDIQKNRGLHPLKGFPIILGYDLGQVNTGIQFMQCFETEFGPYWINFDQICYVSEKIPYPRLTKALLEKMAYWSRHLDYNFQFRHISDNSAFNQFSAQTGSVGAHDILLWSTKFIKENQARYGRLRPIRMTECPKPPGSVEERASILMDLLRADQFMASAHCLWTKQMMLHLEQSELNVLEPKKPQKYLHTFDCLTYPVFFRKHVAIRGFHEVSEKAVEVVA